MVVGWKHRKPLAGIQSPGDLKEAFPLAVLWLGEEQQAALWDALKAAHRQSDASDGDSSATASVSETTAEPAATTSSPTSSSSLVP